MMSVRTTGLTLLVALCVPATALASGSWAVPRFTPTWAELQRDLKALGFKSAAAQKRPARRRKAPPKTTAVAATPDGQNAQTTPTEVAAKDADKQGTETGAPTDKAIVGSTDPNAAGVPDPTGATGEATGTLSPGLPGQSCNCQPMPLPVCPDVARQPADSEANPENIAAPADVQEKKPPAANVKPKIKKKQQPPRQEKTGRPKADDESDKNKLKPKKYWWQQ